MPRSRGLFRAFVPCAPRSSAGGGCLEVEGRFAPCARAHRDLSAGGGCLELEGLFAPCAGFPPRPCRRTSDSPDFLRDGRRRTGAPDGQLNTIAELGQARDADREAAADRNLSEQGPHCRELRRWYRAESSQVCGYSRKVSQKVGVTQRDENDGLARRDQRPDEIGRAHV